jgi:hypothetical protein
MPTLTLIATDGNTFQITQEELALQLASLGIPAGSLALQAARNMGEKVSEMRSYQKRFYKAPQGSQERRNLQGQAQRAEVTVDKYLTVFAVTLNRLPEHGK